MKKVTFRVGFVVLGAECRLRAACILTVCVYGGWLGSFLYINQAACLKIIVVMCNVIIMLALRRVCGFVILYTSELIWVSCVVVAI